jgi:hypothetical protein
VGFAAGFTKGFIRQSEMNQARREQEADREFTAKRDEEAFERQKQLADYQAKLETRQQMLLSGLASRRGAASKDASKISTDFAQLQAIGVDEENLQRIQSTNNPESISNITKMISDQYEAALEAGPQFAQEFRTNINQYLETGLVINPSEDVSFEFQGEIFDTTQPGSAGLVFDERPTAPAELTEIEKVEERVVRDTITAAKTDNSRINTAVTQLNKLKEQADPTERAALQYTEQVLLNRRELIEQATNFWSENQDPSAVFQLYGTQNTDAILESLGTRVKKTQLSPMFNQDYGKGANLDLSGVPDAYKPFVKTALDRLGFKYE